MRKGSEYNPLKDQTLKNRMLFFDGEDAYHLQSALEHEENAIWILVNGDPLFLEEQHRRPIFFDQNGMLSKKLGIESIPTRVSQEKDLLKIEEIPIQTLPTVY